MMTISIVKKLNDDDQYRDHKIPNKITTFFLYHHSTPLLFLVWLIGMYVQYTNNTMQYSTINTCDKLLGQGTCHVKLTSLNITFSLIQNNIPSFITLLPIHSSMPMPNGPMPTCLFSLLPIFFFLFLYSELSPSNENYVLSSTYMYMLHVLVHTYRSTLTG